MSMLITSRVLALSLQEVVICVCSLFFLFFFISDIFQYSHLKDSASARARARVPGLSHISRGCVEYVNVSSARNSIRGVKRANQTIFSFPPFKDRFWTDMTIPRPVSAAMTMTTTRIVLDPNGRTDGRSVTKRRR